MTPFRRIRQANRTHSLRIGFVSIGCLSLCLVLAGCGAAGLGRSTAKEERGENGFTLTESARLGIGGKSRFEEANRAIETGDFLHGIEILEGIIAEVPELTAAHINLGIAYRGIDDFSKAEASIRQALSINPRHPVAHNELGIVFRRSGRFEEARDSYESALARYPDFHFARKNLAILCDLFLLDLQCALEHYEIYHEANPEDEAAEIWIADLRNRTGRGGN